MAVIAVCKFASQLNSLSVPIRLGQRNFVSRVIQSGEPEEVRNPGTVSTSVAYSCLRQNTVSFRMTGLRIAKY